MSNEVALSMPGWHIKTRIYTRLQNSLPPECKDIRGGQEAR
jgi:hypothetical protein